jgi:predicted transcriptional regulator
VVRRRVNGGLESEVLATLWSSDRAMTVGEVAASIGGDLAHTTVQTILARLYEKGAVEREQAGRGHAYRPVLDDAGLAAGRMQAQLDKGGDHAAVLTRFLDTLTPEDEATLAALLRQQHTGGDT